MDMMKPYADWLDDHATHGDDGQPRSNFPSNATPFIYEDKHRRFERKYKAKHQGDTWLGLSVHKQELAPGEQMFPAPAMRLSLTAIELRDETGRTLSRRPVYIKNGRHMAGKLERIEPEKPKPAKRTELKALQSKFRKEK